MRKKGVLGMKLKRITPVLVVVLLTVFALAGCGAPPVPSGKENAEVKESNTSGDSIPIGILVPYTGEMGAFGVSVFDGAKTAVEEINKAGGPLGKPIKLYTEDDRSRVEDGIKGFKKLVNTNKVVAVNGPLSDSMLAVMDYARDSQVLITSPMAGSIEIDNIENPYKFRSVPSDAMDGKVVAKFLLDQGFKEIALLYQNDESKESIAKTAGEEFKKLGGKLVAEIPFNPGQTTYQAELQKVYASKPQLLFLSAGQESGSTILKNWYQQNYGGKIMLSADMAVQRIIDITGKKIMEGIWTEVSSSSTDSEWYKRYEKLHKDFAGKEPGPFSANAYDMQVILALATEAAGKTEGKAIAENMRKVANPPGEVVHTYEEGIKLLREGKKINYEGVSGSVDFDDKGNVYGSYSILQVQDGKWQQVKYYPADMWLDKKAD